MKYDVFVNADGTVLHLEIESDTPWSAGTVSLGDARIHGQILAIVPKERLGAWDVSSSGRK